MSTPSYLQLRSSIHLNKLVHSGVYFRVPFYGIAYKVIPMNPQWPCNKTVHVYELQYHSAFYRRMFI